MPIDRLENWRKSILEDDRQPQSLSNANRNYQPTISLEVQHSMDSLYPWYLYIELVWSELNGKRDEVWGAAYNPKPKPGFERLSLDPPSGKFHNRKDMFEESSKEQRELKKWQEGLVVSGLEKHSSLPGRWQ